MSQLIRVTTTPYQAVHFRQRAQLVPSDMVNIERRKAIARQIAFCSSHTNSGSIDMDSYQKIHRTFSQPDAPHSAGSSAAFTAASSFSAAGLANTNIAGVSHKYSVNSGSFGQTSGISESEGSAGWQEPGVSYPVSMDGSSNANQAAYDLQRSSFELRAAMGNISFIPGFDITIVTQRPDIEFEYLGGFNYVPPQEASAGEYINLFI